MVITLIELYQLFHKKMKKFGKKGFKKLGCRDLSNDEMTRFHFSSYQKNKSQKMAQNSELMSQVVKCSF